MIRLSNQAFKLILDICSECEYKPRSYSGRGMGNRECLGIDLDRYTSAATAVTNILACAYDDADDMEYFEEILEAFRQSEASEDSMGLGSIVYWPGISWNKDYDKNDESDEDECEDDEE